MTMRYGRFVAFQKAVQLSLAKRQQLAIEAQQMKHAKSQEITDYLKHLQG